jgi:hypothetical protein
MKSIAQEVTERLRGQVGRGEGVIAIDSGSVSINVDIESSERYASGVHGITVSPHHPVADVRDAADRIVEYVQDLGEPLTVVECDEGEGRAIVRSRTPEQDEAGVTYWEADVQPKQTSLHRYRKEHDAPERSSVTEPLLHSTVGRVAEQLADAVTRSTS